MTDNKTNSNYQDILDKYAQSISSSNNSEIPQEKIKPEPEPEPINPPESILTSEEETLLKSQAPLIANDALLSPPESLPLSENEADIQSVTKSESSPILNSSPEVSIPPQDEPEPVLNPPRIEPPPVPEAIVSPTPFVSPELTDEGGSTLISPPEKENHFFKYLFFFSLFVFIVILISTIVSLINSQKNIPSSNPTSETSNTPTDVSNAFCEINDQKYFVGESFPAADACNTCICGEDLTINCTTNTCDATPSVKLSPTKSATTSAIPADWKTYSNNTYGFSFQHPSLYKIQTPVPGGDAPMDGSFVFISSTEGKEDTFFLDVTKFTGNLNQFIDKYTTFDSVTKQKQVTLNTVTSLGDIVSQVNPKISIYKHVTHYDNKINPDAKDIISYSAFFIQDNKGFIVRSFNTKDNLIQLTQMLSTFK